MPEDIVIANGFAGNFANGVNSSTQFEGNQCAIGVALQAVEDGIEPLIRLFE